VVSRCEFARKGQDMGVMRGGKRRELMMMRTYRRNQDAKGRATGTMAGALTKRGIH